jgi:ribosomal-protein-alanine N-acetyltransferase
VFLEVEEANAPARALYRRAGFADVGRREGYYEANGAAAVIMRRDIV